MKSGSIILVATALQLGACSTPPLTLLFDVSEADAKACGGSSCADITMSCGAVVSIRILDPSDPTAPYISICEDVAFNRSRNLCSLATIDLPATPIPIDTLEVQIVVYPIDDVPRTPRLDRDGNVEVPLVLDPICPADVVFDGANGFPIGFVEVIDPANPLMPRIVRPAIGGRAYYHPGDEQTIVEVGCPDLAALNAPTCTGDATVAVTATVQDLITYQPVSKLVADRLQVSVGEPRPITVEGELQYQLNPDDTDPLDRTAIGPPAAWGASVGVPLMTAACLEVLEDVPQATATLSCLSIVTGKPIDLPGVRLAKETLDDLLIALGDPPLGEGLVIGVVLDDSGSPIPNLEVEAGPGTVRYLSADGTNFNSPTTTASGIFASQDTPFGTVFTSQNGPTSVATAFGGLVNNKITIVVLQFKDPIGG